MYRANLGRIAPRECGVLFTMRRIRSPDERSDIRGRSNDYSRMSLRSSGLRLRYDFTSRVASIQHPLAVRAIQRERRHVDLEPFAAFALHLVAAGHDAGGGRQRHARGVFEALTGGEHRLLAA